MKRPSPSNEHTTYQGRVSVEECLFQINAATRAGGAVSVTAGSMEMIGSSVKSNYAGEAEGGVFINGYMII